MFLIQTSTNIYALYSLPNVPYGVRWLCKSIRDLALATFGERDASSASLSLIGGFFLLRFVNPAIVSPEVGGARCSCYFYIYP